MDDIEFPATQPVLPSALKGVTAFVEVRSGHDNRSRGVISELRSLGAHISTTLSKDVTHVVFQGGHVSTYKNARQQMCYVVSVQWIEASKELGCRAPEQDYPPPGYEKYEDPHAAKRIKVMKSMQPAFHDEKDDERLNAVLEKIKRRNAKRFAHSENEVCSISSKHENRKTPCFSETRTGLENTNWAESSIPSKRKKSNSVKKHKLFSHHCDSFSSASETIKVGDSDNKRNREKRSSCDDKEDNNSEFHSNSNIETLPKPFEFAVPKPLRNQKDMNGFRPPLAVNKKTEMSSVENPIRAPTEKKTKTDSKPLSVQLEKMKEPNGIDSRANQTRPLTFIENIPREKDQSSLCTKKVEEAVPARQTRRSSGTLGPPVQTQTETGIKERNSDTATVNPFITRVLEVLASRKRTKIIEKSPWRRQNGVLCERRQSPRIKAQRKEITDFEDSDESNLRDVVDKKKTTRPQVNVGASSASAYMLKFLKNKPSKLNSPDTALLDISYGSPKISQCLGSEQKCDSDGSSASLPNAVRVNGNCGENTPVSYDVLQSLSGTLGLGLTDEERSESPVLGTRVKYRLNKSVVSRSCTPKDGLSGQSPSQTTWVPIPKVVNREDTHCTPDASRKSKRMRIRNKTKQDVANDSCLSNCVGNRSQTEETSTSENLYLSLRPVRKVSGHGQNEKLPTLVCTHLGGSDLKRVMNAVRNLGKFEFEEQVSERTTHLVASGPRRTINMLRAICRGCWILRDEWVYQSVKAGKWLREDGFEITEFSSLVQERRLLRQSPNGLGQWDLLSTLGPIFLSPTCQPHPRDLKDLILLSGGSVAKTIEKAAVVIRPPTKTKKENGKPHVAPVWLLDCIVKGEKLPFLTSE